MNLLGFMGFGERGLGLRVTHESFRIYGIWRKRIRD